jgi:VWFA-related protein
VRKALLSSFCSRVIYLSILAIPLGSGVDHPERQQEAQKKLQYDVSVTLKLVQVHVSDKKGNPVIDLDPSDFEIHDNGEIKSIAHFERHVLSRTEAGPPAKPFVDSASQPKLDRKTLFLFDFAFNDLAGIMKSKRAALAFIDTQASPEDEFGVISYRARKGLTLHEYLATDKKRVRQVIEGLGTKEIMGRAAEVESEYSQDHEKLDEALGVDGDIIKKTREADERIYEVQVGDFISSLAELAKALRYIPGTKNIILFSSGIANFVLYGSEKYDTSFYSRYGNPALRERYMALGRELSASNCSIYAINAGGLGTSHRKDRDLLGDLSLGQLAKDTGGKYFDNIASQDAINSQIQDLTGTYYVLGYYINENWDGKYHKIEVVVKRKDCQVLGQTGYSNPKPFSEYSSNERFLHLIDLALSDKSHLQEAIDLPVLVLPYEIRTGVGLFIIAKIPGQKIEEIGRGKTEFVTLILNDRNDVIELQKKDIEKKLSPGVDSFISSSVWLPSGKYECRVVLRDMMTGKGARGSCSINAPEKPGSGMILLPILLLKSGCGTFMIEEETNTKKETEPVRLSDIYPFDRAKYCPIIGTLDRANTRLFALVRCQVSNPNRLEVDFSSYASFVSSGEKTPVPTRVMGSYQQEGAQLYFLELFTGELSPGQWTLDIMAEEMRSNQRATTSRDFVVE